MAIVGTERLAAHIAAIEAVPSVFLIGRICEDIDAAQNEFAAPERMLADPRVAALAVLTRMEDREYWVRQAVEHGKHIMCEHPVASADRAIKLGRLCKQSGLSLHLAEPFSSELDRTLRESLASTSLGTIVFASVDVFIPRDWITPKAGFGVVVEFGAPFARLLSNCFGPIDTIYARTRSLVANRPQEDVAVVQLRFKDGMEGALQINALGSRARVCMAVYGSTDSVVIDKDLQETDPEGLRAVYEGLGQGTEVITRSSTLVDGMLIADWIHQSARHNREVPRREVTRSG